MRKSVWCVCVMCCLVAVSAMAGGAALTAKVGTLGVGADVTVGLSPEVNARLGVNVLPFDLEMSGDSDDEGGTTAEEVQIEIDWQTISALLDWHFAGNWRLTAGIMINNNQLNLSADVGDTVELGDSEYAVSSLAGEVTFDSMAPYVGFGYGNAVGESRWHFAFDAGVMFQGAPEVSATATAVNPAQQTALNAALDDELEEIRTDAEDFDMYLVLSLGLSYRF